MTGPQERADTLGELLLGVEREAEAAALGDVVEELDRLTRQAAAAAVVSPDAWRTLERVLRDLLEALAGRAQAPIVLAMQRAYRLGTQSAYDQLTGEPPPATDVELPDPDAERLVLEQLAGVRAVLRSNEDIPAALATARRATTRVKAANTWHVHRAASEAVTDAARGWRLARRWVAERDGCLHCLAYQGEIAAPDYPFRAGLTYGDRPLSQEAPDGPPLHPHCRCILQVHDVADTSVIVALKREARRSVVKGWSLPTESEAERLRAADRLLRAGAGLPRTVEERAQRAVRRGHFPSRETPTRR